MTLLPTQPRLAWMGKMLLHRKKAKKKRAMHADNMIHGAFPLLFVRRIQPHWQMKDRYAHHTQVGRKLCGWNNCFDMTHEWILPWLFPTIFPALMLPFFEHVCWDRSTKDVVGVMVCRLCSTREDEAHFRRDCWRSLQRDGTYTKSV